MRCAFMMMLSLVVFSAVIFADNITWTGSENGEWHNPANWSGGKVPGENDNVTIPESADNVCELSNSHIQVNNFTNNGEVRSYSNSCEFKVKGEMINNGNINCSTRLSIDCKSDILNNGNIESYKLLIKANSIGNAKDATIKNSSYGNLDISVDNDFVNEGAIESHGYCGNYMSSIYIHAKEVQNWGKIKACDGDEKVNYDGGRISIQADQSITNYASGKIESGKGGDKNIDGYCGRGGHIRLYLHNQFINKGQIKGGAGGINGGDGGELIIYNWGKIDNQDGVLVSGGGVQGGDIQLYSETSVYSGISASGSSSGYKGDEEYGLGKIMAETYINGSVFLAGDSVIVNDDIQSFGKVEAIANHFVCEVNACWEVFFGDDMKIYTTIEGEADFSGTHAQNALGVTALEQNDPLIGEIYIYTYNLIPPAEGMDHICKPDPHIHSADPDFVRASAFGLDQIGDIGETGSLPILFQNQSTASRTLDYAVSSMNGWVMPASGSTTALDPFGFNSADVAFTVPSDATSEDADSVMIVVSIEENYSDTSWVMLGCSGEAAGSVSVPRDNRSQPTDYMLSVYPNPFNSACRIFTWPGSQIEIFDITGRRVARLDASDAFTGGFLWQPDGALGSGEYLIQANTRDGRKIAKQVIYLK